MTPSGNIGANGVAIFESVCSLFLKLFPIVLYSLQLASHKMCDQPILKVYKVNHDSNLGLIFSMWLNRFTEQLQILLGKIWPTPPLCY